MSKTNSAISGASAGASVGGPWGAVIGGAAGFMMGSDDKSESYYDQMLKEAQSIPLPILKEYYPEHYKLVVSINPELEQAVNLGPSAMEGVSTDPRLKQAQMNALNKLQQIGEEGGMTLEDRGRMSTINNEVNSNLKGNQDAIIQNLATKGMSGGMTELVARQQAAQGAANRSSQQGFDVQAEAQKRALSALMNAGDMGGKMQAQDFSQKSQVANSQDAIAKFNAANTQQVRSNNVNTKNQAQQLNAQNVQNVSNKNVDLNNQATQYNASLGQQDYENELRKKGMINTGYQNLAQNSYNQAKDQDAFLGGVFGSVAKYGANSGSKK